MGRVTNNCALLNTQKKNPIIVTRTNDVANVLPVSVLGATVLAVCTSEGAGLGTWICL